VSSLKLKSKRVPKKPDVWVTEVNVKDSKLTPALKKLIALVRRYEDIS
jgi:hypothetical protein